MKKENYLLFICLLVLSFSACKQKAKPVSPFIDLVNKKFEAMNRHDTNAIAKLYDENALIQSPNMEKTEIGPNGIRAVYRRYFTTSPDMVYTITRVLPGDSSVTVEYTFAGTMKHLEASVPQYMLGKQYSIKSCTILEVHNGKIIADISYFDQVAFLRQVGFFDQH
jgi:steroid delta-isomerase-like uncharacterized protein